MLVVLPPEQRQRPVYLVANDTLVESPLLSRHLQRSLKRITEGVAKLHIPLYPQLTLPPVDQTFWVNLIGRGNRAPTRSFRWCTDRLKISPTAAFIRSHIAATGRVIFLLGVRRTESTRRATAAKQYDDGQRLHPHHDIPACDVFRPILELTTNEVWLFLMQRRPPWGGTHRDLITLYKNASGDECPLVMDRSSAPSCGSSAARFGCWTCTVVKKDRSLAALVDSGYAEFEPLLDFRDWLITISDDAATYRQARRRNLKILHRADGSIRPGPFTLAARQEILDRLLKLQNKVGWELISAAEVQQIHDLWKQDEAIFAKGPLQQYIEF